MASVSKCFIRVLRNSIKFPEMLANISPNLINCFTPLIDLIETYEAPSFGLRNMYPWKRRESLFILAIFGKNLSWP